VRAGDVVRLIMLAAIWGGSFIFMRVLAPVLGPVVTADLRVLIAGIALIAYFRIIKFDVQWRRLWKQYLFIGAFNSALPFYLYSFAALHIPASYSVILNSTSPFFGAIFSAMWLNDRLTGKKVIGLLVGASGVVLVAGVGSARGNTMTFLAMGACILATVCYGITATYAKKSAAELKPMALAGASQLMAGLVLIPALPLSPVRGTVTPLIVVLVVIFALVCSAIAYLLYYRLIADLGPTKALTVTFLMPVFGMIWGATILHESITVSMLAGTALILLGTTLVLNLRLVTFPRRSIS